MSFTEERARWLYHHYRWLERALPPKQGNSVSRLVLPTAEFFPDRYHSDHASAVLVFNRVRSMMGMDAWHCLLESQSSGEREMQADLARSGVLGPSTHSDAAGTFSKPENDVLITYAPALLKDPAGLVATLAHELCHYLLATVQEEPPATWAELEPLTDLCAVSEGFGVFLANSAFQFAQWSANDQQGWSYERRGYLGEEELGFATAIFSVRNRIDPHLAARQLKPNAREVYCDALDYVADLESNPQTSGLTANE